MNFKENVAKKLKDLSTESTKRLIFYIIMMALPVIHVAVFYFGINISSFALAFQKPNFDGTGFVFAGFENFAEIFKEFREEEYMWMMVKNSAVYSVLSLFLGSAFSILFSYYIYKKNPFSSFFKVILYMPNIISGLIFVLLFKYFADIAIPEIYELITGKTIIGLISSVDTSRITVMLYSCWVGFGGSVLLYSGAMSAISDSVIESAQLDGAKPMREFFSIIIPSVWPTFTTFMLLKIVGFFTDQMNLFTFYGEMADRYMYTIGYYLYVSVLTFTRAEYPYLSAFGLMLTLIAVPATLILKYTLTKFGPSND